MLKITPRADHGGRHTLLLDGQVTGPWVAELRTVYSDTQADGASEVTLDLKGVTLIDADGVAFFSEVGPSVTVINCSLFAAEQLKDVMTRPQRVQP